MLVLLILIFGFLFWFSGTFLKGNILRVVQFLCGAIIIIALLIFLLGLAGAGPRIRIN